MEWSKNQVKLSEKVSTGSTIKTRIALSPTQTTAVLHALKFYGETAVIDDFERQRVNSATSAINKALVKAINKALVK
jgi:hypothetical protein